VKRLYFLRSARRIRMEGTKSVVTRTGRRVCGVIVRYEERLGPTRVPRNSRTFALPARWVKRTKVMRLPRNAKGARLTDRAREGPPLAVS